MPTLHPEELEVTTVVQALFATKKRASTLIARARKASGRRIDAYSFGRGLGSEQPTTAEQTKLNRLSNAASKASSEFAAELATTTAFLKANASLLPKAVSDLMKELIAIAKTMLGLHVDEGPDIVSRMQAKVDEIKARIG